MCNLFQLFRFFRTLQFFRPLLPLRPKSRLIWDTAVRNWWSEGVPGLKIAISAFLIPLIDVAAYAVYIGLFLEAEGQYSICRAASWNGRVRLSFNCWPLSLCLRDQMQHQQAQRSEVVCKHCKEACWLLDNPCEDTGILHSAWKKYTPLTDYSTHTATATPFIYSFFGNCATSAPISTFMCLWAIYIFPGSVHIFPPAEKADPSWKYLAHRHMNVELGLRPQYSFSRNMFTIFGILSLQCIEEYSSYMSWRKGKI